MFIAIATEDFNTFTDNNEAENGMEYTEKTEYPIFTGMSVDETRNHVESYFRNCYDPDEDIPEYEVCEITTAAIVRGAYNLVVTCDYMNIN